MSGNFFVHKDHIWVYRSDLGKGENNKNLIPITKIIDIPIDTYFIDVDKLIYSG